MKKIKSLVSFETFNFVIKSKLFSSYFLLISIGFLMIYSATVPFDNANRYIIKQSFIVFLSLLSLFCIVNIPINFYKKNSRILILFAIFLLGILLIPGVGREVNGSQRWFSIPGFSFQPSELVKLLIIFYASDYVTRKLSLNNKIRESFLPITLVLSIISIFLLQQPDFGTFVVIISITFGIFFLGGLNFKQILLVLIFSILICYLLIKYEPYRFTRFTSFLDPWDDPYGSDYQLAHSLFAFGNGGFFGVGLGQSIQKQLYLPEAHTDFILSIIAEELGFFGVLILCFFILKLNFIIFNISKKALENKDLFSSLICQGVAIWISLQSIINICVCTGLFPTKGISLPFISYGGSSLLILSIAVSIVIRVSYENKYNYESYKNETKKNTYISGW